MTYLDDLKMAISQNHGCEARLEEFVAVKEVSLGEISFEGEVGIFFVEGHPRAKRCYAWGFPTDDEAQTREITTILEIPPVVSAETAVRAAIASRARNG